MQVPIVTLHYRRAAATYLIESLSAAVYTMAGPCFSEAGIRAS
ncbi:protein of unknown function [Caballeronia sp. S22]